MRKVFFALLVAGGLAVAIPVPSFAEPDVSANFTRQFPAVISLPKGFQPEGITTGRGTSFYVGSGRDGAIYRGDLRTGEGAVLVPGSQGRAAVGTEVDQWNRLFVADSRNEVGGATVYDAVTGAQLATYQFTPPGIGIVNDVVVTHDGAYFTDSLRPFLYLVPFGPDGRLGDQSSVRTVPLTGDLVHQENGRECPGAPGINVNGIEASPDGRTLVIGQTNTGLLFSVDPGTGITSTIDLGGKHLGCADGLVRSGHTLYVTQPIPGQVSAIHLSPSYTQGTLISEITGPALDSPTTSAVFGPFVYAVNARFSTPPTPETPYQVVRLPAG